MIAQQRKELRSQIQNIKKTLPNIDKKAKKAAQEEIKQLELRIDGLDSYAAKSNNTDQVVPVLGDKKPNRQQQRKQRKKAEMEQMRQEAANEPTVNYAERERQKMEQVLQQHKLQVHRIQPDGNCLFNAIVHQLEVFGRTGVSQDDLRQEAVKVMQNDRDNFEPFATDEQGNPIEFDNYCHMMLKNGWGGHLEIQALSKALSLSIRVYHADGTVNKFGDDDQERLKISYHEFEYGLGSHYNSLVDQSENAP